MSDEWKPCPFCGREPTVDRFKSVELQSFIWVYCPICNTEPDGEYWPYELDRWNTRPIEDALRQQLEAAQARIAELEAAQRWIPISENLPPAYELFLVCSEYGKIFPAYYAISGWIKTWGQPDEHIAFWMPLPQPPEQEEK